MANDFEAALNAGKVIGAPFQVADGGLYAAVPQNTTIMDLEKYLPAPRRNRGTARLLDEASFIVYVRGEIAGIGPSFAPAIWATKETASFQVVFNPGTLDIPDWADIRASYEPAFSEEWRAWTGLEEEKLVAQAKFAEFIEEHQADIRTPLPADMLAIATNLKASKSINYISGLDLSNGAVQFLYEETVGAGTTKGQIEVPQTIVIGIPIYDRGPHYGITCRLRWKIVKEAGNKLAFGIDMMNKETSLDHAFNTMVSGIENGTGLKCLLGVPPPARA